MNLDQIEDMIRRFLAAGVAVVFVLVAPVSGEGADTPGAAGTSTVETGRAGNGEVDIIEVGPPGAAGEPDDTGSPGTDDEDATDDPADADGPPDPGTGDGSGDGSVDDESAAASGSTGSGSGGPGDTGDDGDTGTGSSDDTTGTGDPVGGESDGAGAGDTGGDAGTTDGARDEDAKEPDPEVDLGDNATEPDATGRDTDTGTDADGSSGSDTDTSRTDTDGTRGTGTDGTDTDTGGTGMGTGSSTDTEGSNDTDPDGTSTDTDGTSGTSDPDADRDEPAPEADLAARGPADADEPGVSDDESAAGDGATGDSGTGEGAAAERYDWGTPVQEDDFTSSRLTGWTVYRGTGHDGEGRRSADAISVQDGVLSITGDEQGTTGGMCWGEGQRHGRWEARVRATAADPSYHALLLLWPDADDAPVGGEVDFMELQDPTRRSADFYLHFGEDDDQVHSRARVDATRWHDWAVEWTPEAVVGYLDGEEWFRSTDPDTFPPGPMHLCIQLDWFPEDGTEQVRASRMEVDRVRQYAIDDDGATVEPASASGNVLERMFSWG